jgi:hypothetical protein
VRPLVLIYWTRLALGIVAAIISALVAMTLDVHDFSAFTTSLTIALMVYLLSYYPLKAKFYNKVEKQSKIMTMGIGIYFITWAVFFILFYSIIYNPVL